MTLTNAPVDDVLAALVTEMLASKITDARNGREPAVVLHRLEGWAAHEAIAAAAYVVARHSTDVCSAILEGANAHGESDSIATLAGALVGARIGITGLPVGLDPGRRARRRPAQPRL
jgi:ADP-ribosylglycohydrolase